MRDRWLSEREWITDFRDEVEVEAPKRLNLELEITKSNIDILENISCDEIVTGLLKNLQENCAASPSRLELRSAYADPTNRRVYASLDELESKWLDLFLHEHPVNPVRTRVRAVA